MRSPTVWIVYVHTQGGCRSAMCAFSAEEMADSYIERIYQPNADGMTSAQVLGIIGCSKQPMRVINPGDKMGRV